MTPDEKLKLFHWCCQSIVDNKDQKALNWAVVRAQGGLKCTDPSEIHIRVLYIVGNISYWRGDLAKKVRAALKSLY